MNNLTYIRTRLILTYFFSTDQLQFTILLKIVKKYIKKFSKLIEGS